MKHCKVTQQYWLDNWTAKNAVVPIKSMCYHPRIDELLQSVNQLNLVLQRLIIK